jgi:hypothetical protein
MDKKDKTIAELRAQIAKLQGELDDAYLQIEKLEEEVTEALADDPEDT